jgi:GDP-D-mannose 3',5'-epimerase
MQSSVHEPLNLGSDQLVTINRLVDVVESDRRDQAAPSLQAGRPAGVRGRNSDNTLIRQRLGWAPSIALGDGLERTYGWIYGRMTKEKVAA